VVASAADRTSQPPKTVASQGVFQARATTSLHTTMAAAWSYPWQSLPATRSRDYVRGLLVGAVRRIGRGVYSRSEGGGRVRRVTRAGRGWCENTAGGRPLMATCAPRFGIRLVGARLDRIRLWCSAGFGERWVFSIPRTPTLQRSCSTESPHTGRSHRHSIPGTDVFVGRTPLSPIRDIGEEVISYFPIQDGLTAAASKPTRAIVLREVFCSASGTFSASVGGGDRGSGGVQSSGLLRVTRG